ncbi:MAG: hypothetical protein ACK55I_09345, partial [bacterium]
LLSGARAGLPGPRSREVLLGQEDRVVTLDQRRGVCLRERGLESLSVDLAHVAERDRDALDAADGC